MIHRDVSESMDADAAELLPVRLQTLGFRLIQVTGGQAAEDFHYILPPLREVTGGPFLMGSVPGTSSLEQADEMPQHQVTLPRFQIGAYPVTVAEYACAVDAGALEEPSDGYSEEEEGYLWEYQLANRELPVVNINWFRALAYARWLREVTGMPWELPTEAQWEKVARGTDGRIFPWGNDRDGTLAAVSDGVTNTVTPVGSFPASSASPSGMMDLVGGVGEWTRSSYRGYPYLVDDGREEVEDAAARRVMRGGYYGGYSRQPRRSLADRGSCRVVH